MTTSAVVFGYGDIGVRCTRVLLKQGIDVKLVVTHDDDPLEHRWHSSMAEFARESGIPVVAPPGPDYKLAFRVGALAPDFVFSFGSLLPRFRGRAPVNWAILRGATQTGATLHYMTSRADAGDIVDQSAVPIRENDSAYDVFLRVADAAETVLDRSLPLLVQGTAPRTPQDLSKGEYCGRRRPEDGRIDWSRGAREIHNLVRAVAPPFPGAFANFDGERWLVTRTQVLARRSSSFAPRTLHTEDGHCVVTCVDGNGLALLGATDPRGPVDLARLRERLERSSVAVS